MGISDCLGSPGLDLGLRLWSSGFRVEGLGLSLEFIPLNSLHPKPFRVLGFQVQPRP